MRVAMLTSTRAHCGIAAYSASLANALAPHVDLDVVPVDLPQDGIDRLNAADLIHIQHEYSFWGSAWPGKSGFPALLSQLDRPRVVTAHTVAPAESAAGVDTPGSGVRGAAKRLAALLPGARRFIERAPFEGAAALIAHTEEACAILQSRGLEAVHHLTMPCPVPVEPEDPEAARRRLGLLGTPYLLGFGFLSPAKGFDAAIGAFAGLDYPGRLVLAGAARDAAGREYLASLETLARVRGVAQWVLFPGFLPDSELTELIRSADLVLLPYTSATGSYALSLTLACGAPVLRSSLPAFEGTPGMKAEPTEAGLREAIPRTLDLLGEHGQAWRERALAWAAEHSWRKAGEWHARLYEEALKAGR